ncbi:MAG TPA: hypothetical protein DEV81_16185, partial [Cyanobacteria bacterium UBA11049]|nr:hypothetical protein [Cyanobacteria bacterium UBA11049]
MRALQHAASTTNNNRFETQPYSFKTMVNIAAEERAKRDILTCLGIWLTLELICFTVLPLLDLLQPGDRF